MSEVIDGKFEREGMLVSVYFFFCVCVCVVVVVALRSESMTSHQKPINFMIYVGLA